jgi:capsular polysaccharide biosynthesis protein
LSTAARSGIRSSEFLFSAYDWPWREAAQTPSVLTGRSFKRDAMTIKTRPFSPVGRQNVGAPDSAGRPGRLLLSESLHTLWRKAVRIPWRNARRSMRRALAGSNAGIPVSVDWTTKLAVVPFSGRFPPPLSQCEVVAPIRYEKTAHPLSVNSTKDERVHYLDHTVEAPAMMLEHLVDQYWFPYFGLLVSEQGQVWRHSFLGPFREGFLTRVKAVVDVALPDGKTEHRLFPEQLRRVPRIRGEHLLLAGSDQPNYGHYLLDVVPLIHLGVRMGMPMLTWTLRPWQRALIARLDVPQGLIREIKPEPVFLEHAITSNRHSGAASINAHPQTKEVFAAILANIEKHAPVVNRPRRLLVCRGVRDSRNIRNRKAMIEALAALDFAAIQPEKLPFEEQAMLFANAEFIVAEFGSGMVNAIFSRPGTKLVEIIAEGQFDPWSSHFGAMNGFEHVVLFEHQSDEALLKDPRHAQDSEFSYDVNVPRLVETVESMIRRQDGRRRV